MSHGAATHDGQTAAYGPSPGRAAPEAALTSARSPRAWSPEACGSPSAPPPARAAPTACTGDGRPASSRCPAAATPPPSPPSVPPAPARTSSTPTGCTPPYAPRSRSAAAASPLVVTWHTRAHAEGARGRLLRLLERGPPARPPSCSAPRGSWSTGPAAGAPGRPARPASRSRARRLRDDRGGPTGRTRPAPNWARVGRPLLVSARSAQHGHDILLDAARAWRALDPVPLLVVAGEGPRAAALRRRIADEGAARRPRGRPRGHRRAPRRRRRRRAVRTRRGRAAARPGGAAARRPAGRRPRPAALPELVGEAAELVPYGDAEALSGAVVRLLGDPARRERLADSGRGAAAGWPTEDDTIAQVLSVYDELAQPLPTGRPRLSGPALAVWRRARSARLRASTDCGSSRSVPSSSPMRASRL